MAVGFPQIDLRPGLSGGSDTWDNDVGGELLLVDYFEVNNSVSVTPNIATLTLSTFAPTIAYADPKNVTTANPSSLTLTAQTPITKLDNRPTPGTTSLTLTTFTPTVDLIFAEIDITLDFTTLTISTYAVTITVSDNKNIELNLTTLTTTRLEPTVSYTKNVYVSPDTAELRLTNYPLTSRKDDFITLGINSLTITPNVITITKTDNHFITLGKEGLALFGQPPTVTVKVFTLDVLPSALTITNYQPEVQLSDNISLTTNDSLLQLETYTPLVQNRNRRKMFTGVGYK